MRTKVRVMLADQSDRKTYGSDTADDGHEDRGDGRDDTIDGAANSREDGALR